MVTKPVVVITGASSGIGHLIARYAVHEGYFVIANARRKKEMEIIKNMAPDRVTLIEGDVTRPEIQDLLVDTAQRHGRLDYLINNAGFGWVGPLEKETTENVHQMIGLNVVALIELTKKCLPLLKQNQKGRILNIASVLGEIALPFMATYTASKFAVVGFTKALNLELGGTSVSASAYCPTGVKTEFAKVAFDNSGSGENFNSRGESAEKVSLSIWQKRDSTSDIVHPTPLAWVTATAVNSMGPFTRTVIRNRVAAKGEKVLG